MASDRNPDGLGQGAPITERGPRWTARLGVGVALVAALALAAACGGDDDGEGGAATGDGGGGGGGGEMVMFVPTTTNTYVAGWVEGARAEAEELGYDAKVVENNFDQTEQDTQVQQELASGDAPDGYIWWPSDNRAGVASLRRLSETGVPVVQTNQTPLPDAEEFVTAYAGVDDKLNGRVAGENVLAARDALVERGAELSSPEGNLVVILFPAGYQAGIDRLEGVKEGMGSESLNIVREEFVDFTADAAYDAMSQVYPALEDEGIDAVLVGDDGQAPGVLKALEEAGRTPGEDIMVVTSTCKTDGALQASGEVFATGIQPPLFEGKLAVDVLARLIENGGQTSDQHYEAPADPDAPPALDGDPAEFNSMPNPPFVGGHETPKENEQAVSETTLWGQGMEELCST